MAYDRGLAERLRLILEEEPGYTEKPMFGGLCILLDGKMCCGIVKDELMVRVGPAHYSKALKQQHARPMDFTGRPLKGFVYVAPEGLDSDRQLEWWVRQGVEVARTAKAATGRSKRTARRKRRSPS